ncbi:protein-disulfide reductase DsbD N-terminal domain-containing protein [Mucilaginibacter sp. UR6-11]|uniref:protein-disulfide reductase DsbD N-terminal domain-containing protein n=1 Tax=Mucilaginibacter sp. UR6-11 TaxID=1435644 RepID=UPI001E39D467|nr:protein-disulfide reductase DsbD N-terminal domain-containing protein [Mucilaginibacter sp. UR6-11]MCC8427020.1 protein-disulfide reductase DsbD N-terminal domain-containing protein [Mucilaginibacter sp. UR6-11]
MKKLLIIPLLMITGFVLQTSAQILAPVKWSYGAKKINAKEAVVFMKASIDEGWHLYSQFVKDGGPVKTTFTFASGAYSLDGATKEPTPITRNEKVFNMDVGFFEHEVIFQQKIKLKAGQVTVKGKLEYMTCNDKQCLPPETVEFSIPVK